MSALLLVFIGAVVAQTPLDPPPLETPPLDTPAEERDDDDDNDDDAPPVLQPLTPAPDGDKPPVLKPKRKPEARAPDARTPEPDGLDPFLVGAMQWGVPCATTLLAAPCLLLAAYGCPVIICVPCVLPAVNGYLAAFVGDRFGKSRAPAIWPVIAAYGAGLVTSVAALTVFVLIQPALAGNLSDPVVLGGVGVAFLAGGAASLAVPISYALTAEPKRLGDDGSEVPGWFAPNHPTTKQKKPSKPLREPLDAPPRLTAMRF